MRQDFVEFEPSHTAVLITNHLPTVSGDDPAVWRRLRVVPFDVVIPEGQRDPELPERLQGAADEVLTWCIRGWEEYRQIGLAEPQQVLARTDEYRADSDVIARFISDECVTVPTVKMVTSKLFEAFQQWRATEGVPELSMRAFGQALERHGYPAIKDRNGRYRQGIALRATGL
jgi:putative DNA primase/helicase